MFEGLENYTGCQLLYREDGVFLLVHSQVNEVDESTKKQFIQFLQRKKVKGLQSQSVYEALYSSIGELIKVAEPQREEIIDEEIKLRISKDALEAYIALLPPDKQGKRLSADDIVDYLKSQNVTYGVDIETVKKIVSEHQYGIEHKVAQGKSAQNGIDSILHFHFDIRKKPKPEVKADGTIDFRELGLIKNVKNGQVLATITPATEGIPGMNVLGQILPPRPGHICLLQAGSNVSLSDDGLTMTSNIDGLVEVIDGKLHVLGVYEVHNHVDNSTGNIDFIGSVIIHGNVLTGFQVKAGGNIEVRGVVEGANLIADGDIVLMQGMQGMGRGSIQSGGTVTARFIENSFVQAKENVFAEALMHSTVRCDGEIHVDGKRGLIVGGVVYAQQRVTASTLGSPMATKTRLEVGISNALREEYSELQKEFSEIESEINKANQILALLSKYEKQSTLTPDKQELKIKTIRTKLHHNENRNLICKKLAEIDRIFKSVDKGQVQAKGTVYPGVKVTIGNSSIYVKDALSEVVFLRHKSEIRVNPLKG